MAFEIEMLRVITFRIEMLAVMTFAIQMFGVMTIGIPEYYHSKHFNSERHHS